MESIEFGYKDAKVAMELVEDKVVVLRVQGKKMWELRGKKVPPLNGEFRVNARDFILLLEGAWGIGKVRAQSEEGVAVDAEYDWSGWERGDDIMKLKFTRYPESRTILYLYRWNILIFSAFLKHVKTRLDSYIFKSRDLQFIRTDGETIISRAGEEIMRFSPAETRALRGTLENALLKGTTLEMPELTLSAYPKARWIFAPSVEQPKPLYKLFMCIV